MIIKKFNFNNVKVNLICNKENWNSSDTPILFLHGFTGCSLDWQFLFPHLDKNFFAAALDLVGHGKTDSPNNLNFYSEIFQHNVITEAVKHLGFEKFIIAGYSMGGRLALGYTINNREKVNALILESTTAGIENPAERNERINADKVLADRILSEGVQSFINYWLALPIFSGLSGIDSAKYQSMKRNKLNNSKTGLANTLKAFSTGKMISYWKELSKLKCRTLLIAGELDSKFLYLNKQMNLKLKNSQLEVIKNCGHNTHLENPNEFIILINNFLKHL